MNPLIIAHRCGPGKYPEQSIASAKYALECRADIVEMDVQFTSDGVPVICHDPNTARVFGVDSLASDMNFEKFMSLRHVIDRSCPSHSLDDILEAGIAPILLHQKLTGEPLREVMRHVIRFGYEQKVVIGVQYPMDVDIVKGMSPDTKTLAFMPRLELLDEFLTSRTDIVRLWEDWVTEARVKRAHDAGYQVWIMAGKPTTEGVGYTTEENMRAWMALKVDGILVNDVAWARKVIYG